MAKRNPVPLTHDAAKLALAAVLPPKAADAAFGRRAGRVGFSTASRDIAGAAAGHAHSAATSAARTVTLTHN
jgi:hypothetical protein